jgi:hypothetical protein
MRGQLGYYARPPPPNEHSSSRQRDQERLLHWREISCSSRQRCVAMWSNSERRRTRDDVATRASPSRKLTFWRAGVVWCADVCSEQAEQSPRSGQHFRGDRQGGGVACVAPPAALDVSGLGGTECSCDSHWGETVSVLSHRRTRHLASRSTPPAPHIDGGTDGRDGASSDFRPKVSGGGGALDGWTGLGDALKCRLGRDALVVRAEAETTTPQSTQGNDWSCLQSTGTPAGLEPAQPDE